MRTGQHSRLKFNVQENEIANGAQDPRYRQSQWPFFLFNRPLRNGVSFLNPCLIDVKPALLPQAATVSQFKFLKELYLRSAGGRSEIILIRYRSGIKFLNWLAWGGGENRENEVRTNTAYMRGRGNALSYGTGLFVFSNF